MLTLVRNVSRNNSEHDPFLHDLHNNNFSWCEAR